MTYDKYTPEEDVYIVWAIRHGGRDMELAHDLDRSIASVRQHIKVLRERYDLPERKHNAGRKGKVKNERT